MAIVIDDVHDPRLRVDPLFKDEQVVIVSPSHRLASRSWVEPKDLAQEHLMLYTTDPDDSFALKNILAPAGVTPARVSSGAADRGHRGDGPRGPGRRPAGAVVRGARDPRGRIRALRITRMGRPAPVERHRPGPPARDRHI